MLRIVFILLLLSPVFSAKAQIKLISPERVERLHQQTHYCDNWADPEAFYPKKIAITLQGTSVSESGYAELLSSLRSQKKQLSELRLALDWSYVATFRLADTVKRFEPPLSHKTVVFKLPLVNSMQSNYLSTASTILKNTAISRGLHLNPQET